MGAPPTLSVRGISKRFGAVTALDAVSFDVPGKGLVGILGPNGAGKTTLLDILQGLEPATSGSFELFGAEPSPYPRGRVGVVLQQEVRLERASAHEYAELFAAIQGVKGGAARILKRAALEHRRAIPMTRLSGGEAARLFIAAADVHEPELLFLDEPSAHLDPASKRAVGADLAAIAHDRAVVMTTHDLAEADRLCDRLVFLVGGAVRAEGSREALLANVPGDAPSMEDAFFHYCGVRIEGGEEVTP